MPSVSHGKEQTERKKEKKERTRHERPRKGRKEGKKKTLTTTFKYDSNIKNKLSLVKKGNLEKESKHGRKKTTQ